jgi:LacI family transcriptional regulator
MTGSADIFAMLAHRLDRQAGPPLYKQLRKQLAQLIYERHLRPGDNIPPQRDLSQLCRVSEMTVRRALQELAQEGLLQARAGSGTKVVDPQQRQEQLSQTASTVARRWRIGIVMASLSDGYPFLSRMMEQLDQEAGTQVRYQLLDLPTCETDPATIAQIVPLRALDGVILMSPVNLTLVTLCQRQRIPYVLLYNDLADEQSHCIVVDYASGLLEAVAYLVHNQRRRIALVTAARQRFSTGQMVDAYHTACQLHGLQVQAEWLVHASYEERQGYEAMIHLLGTSPRPDAVLFASDYQARGGLVALQEAKMAVPQEIAVVGAGRLLREKEWPVPLSTIDLHLELVMSLAVRGLSNWIAGTGQMPLRQVVRSTWHAGATA